MSRMHGSILHARIHAILRIHVLDGATLQYLGVHVSWQHGAFTPEDPRIEVLPQGEGGQPVCAPHVIHPPVLRQERDPLCHRAASVKFNADVQAAETFLGKKQGDPSERTAWTIRSLLRDTRHAIYSGIQVFTLWGLKGGFRVYIWLKKLG